MLKLAFERKIFIKLGPFAMIIQRLNITIQHRQNIRHPKIHKCSSIVDIIKILTTRSGFVAVNVIELNVFIQIATNKVNCVANLDGLGELSI